jgi:nucleotide-binding universal stress UspA family protein
MERGPIKGRSSGEGAARLGYRPQAAAALREAAMTPIRHILCPTDFSRFSESSLRYGVLLAKWFGADLTCLLVLADPFGPIRGYPLRWIGADPTAKEKLRERLDLFAAPAKAAGVAVQSAIVEGEVPEAILKEARRVPGSLIVLGTHGHGGFENLVLGSVTEKVLRKAPCPVLTVPRQPERSPAAAVPFGKILCAIDFSPCSEAAFEAALELASASGATLTAVHVLRELPAAEAPELVHFNVPEYRRLLEKEARERLNGLVARKGRGKPVEIRLMTGKPWRGILHLAHDIEADLVVLGVQGRSAADLLLFGSTAHHVVRAAPCPVLTVRAG